jgi:hypothetical protein
MSYGFKVISGTAGQVQQISSDEPAGVFVDQFYVPYGQTVNRGYGGGGYSTIFAQCTFAGDYRAYGTCLVNISGLSLSVTAGYRGANWGTAGVYCVVVGK